MFVTNQVRADLCVVAFSFIMSSWYVGLLCSLAKLTTTVHTARFVNHINMCHLNVFRNIQG